MTALTMVALLLTAGPCPRWHEINTGDRVSCDGVVGPKDQLTKLVACKKVDLPKCERLRQRDKELSAVELAMLRKHLKTANKRADEHLAETRRLRGVLERVSAGSAWYEHPALWASVGLVVGVVVTVSVVMVTR